MASKTTKSLTILFFLLSNYLLAQDNTIKNLKERLQNKNKQEEILDYLSKKSMSTDSLNHNYVNLGLTFSKDNKLLDWQVEFTLNKAKLAFIKDEVETSISNTLEADNILNEFTFPTKRNHKWRVHFLLAQNFKKIGAYEEAIFHRKKQLAINLKKTIQNISGNINIINNIGLLYLTLNKNDSAIKYFRIAYHTNKLMNNNNMLHHNNLALGFKASGVLDSSKHYLTIAYNKMIKSEQETHTFLFGLISGNLSQCLPPNGNEIEIKKLLENDIRLSKKFERKASLSNAFLGMSDLHSYFKRYSMAKTYIDSAMMINNHKNKNFKNKELELTILKKYIEVFENLKDYKNIQKYSRFYLNKNNSLFGKAQVNQLTSSLTTYKVLSIKNELKLKKAQIEKNVEKIKALEKEDELSKTKTTLFSFIGAFLLTLSLVIIFKLRSDNKKNQEINNLKSQAYETSIENQKQRLTETTISLSRKKNFSEELIQRLSKIDGIENKELTPFKQYISNELQLDQSILETEKYISELSSDFFLKLELNFPKLTKNDIKLCGLVRLGLSNKQIAIIKYITPGSVKTSKNRLSKKMDLPSGSNIYEHLKTL